VALEINDTERKAVVGIAAARTAGRQARKEVAALALDAFGRVGLGSCGCLLSVRGRVPYI
jgi:hypothetical protein